MKKLLILLLITNYLLSFSQADSIGPFIKFKNGTIMRGSKVSYESGLFKSKVLLDGKEYKSSDLSFFRDEKGVVYGNINGFTPSIGNGKGVFFFSTSFSNMSTQTFDGGYSKTSTNKQIKYFYSEGFTDIKRVNFLNFQYKMQDDPESKLLIYKAGKARDVSIISFAILGSVCLANFALLGNESYTNSNAVFVSGAVALSSLITGIVYNRIKLKRTQKAINKYYGVYVPIGE